MEGKRGPMKSNLTGRSDHECLTEQVMVGITPQSNNFFAKKASLCLKQPCPVSEHLGKHTSETPEVKPFKGSLNPQESTQSC